MECAAAGARHGGEWELTISDGAGAGAAEDESSGGRARTGQHGALGVTRRCRRWAPPSLVAGRQVVEQTPVSASWSWLALAGHVFEDFS